MLNPKNAMASSDTGIMPMASRTMLMIMRAETNSIGRRGEIIRLPRLRAHISSRNEIENPSCPRNRMSHIITAPMNTPLARAAARHVEKNLLQGLAAVAGEQMRRRVVVLDAPLLHDDDALAQPLDLG